MTNLLHTIYNRLSNSKLPFLSILVEKLFHYKSSSYSIYGEDLILNAILSRINYLYKIELSLNYVDVGAWRPLRGSNTYLSYRAGNRGTVVEPNEKLKKLWIVLRPKDFFIQAACGNSENSIFFVFEEGSAANSVSPDFVRIITDRESRTISRTYLVKTLTLRQIILEHLSHFSGDYFLDIDVEGMDYDVISNENFDGLLRPLIILIEDTSEKVGLSSINAHLESLGYRLIARSPITSFYIDSKREDILGGDSISLI